MTSNLAKFSTRTTLLNGLKLLHHKTNLCATIYPVSFEWEIMGRSVFGNICYSRFTFRQFQSSRVLNYTLHKIRKVYKNSVPNNLFLSTTLSELPEKIPEEHLIVSTFLIPGHSHGQFRRLCNFEYHSINTAGLGSKNAYGYLAMNRWTDYSSCSFRGYLKDMVLYRQTRELIIF